MTRTDSSDSPTKDPDRNNLYAALMVLAGAFLLAFVDAMNYEEGNSSRILLLLLSAILLFGSAFFLRRLRWWLILYIPGVWLASGVLSLLLSGPAMQLARGLEQTGECGGISQYWDLVEETGENHDARLLYTQQSPDAVTPQQWRTYANAVNTDIQNLRSASPPKAAEKFNDQFILVLEGWSDIFIAVSNGSFENQMLFDLQEEDDEMEDLQRELATKCG